MINFGFNPGKHFQIVIMKTIYVQQLHGMVDSISLQIACVLIVLEK